MPYTEPVSLVALLARTTSGQGVAYDTTSTDDEDVTTAARSMARLWLTVSAASGTSPTLAVYIETSRDNAVWTQVGAFTSVSAVGVQSVVVAGLEKYIRARWVIGGTSPSFTFSALGDSIMVYATPEQFFRLGYPQSALIGASSKVTLVDVYETLEAVTDDADGFLLERGETLPLKKWGKDLSAKVCGLAALPLLLKKGTNPEGEAYKNAKAQFDEARTWFQDLAKGKVRPAWLSDANAEAVAGGAYVLGDDLRGW